MKHILMNYLLPCFPLTAPQCPSCSSLHVAFSSYSRFSSSFPSCLLSIIFFLIGVFCFIFSFPGNISASYFPTLVIRFLCFLSIQLFTSWIFFFFLLSFVHPFTSSPLFARYIVFFFLHSPDDVIFLFCFYFCLLSRPFLTSEGSFYASLSLSLSRYAPHFCPYCTISLSPFSTFFITSSSRFCQFPTPFIETFVQWPFFPSFHKLLISSLLTHTQDSFHSHISLVIHSNSVLPPSLPPFYLTICLSLPSFPPFIDSSLVFYLFITFLLLSLLPIFPSLHILLMYSFTSSSFSS